MQCFAFKIAVLAADDASANGSRFHRFRGTFTFDEVTRVVETMAPPLKGSKLARRSFLLEYTDAEGDVVRIASELEWAECLTLQAAAAAPLALDSVVIRLVARWRDCLAAVHEDQPQPEIAAAKPVCPAEPVTLGSQPPQPQSVDGVSWINTPIAPRDELPRDFSPCSDVATAGAGVASQLPAHAASYLAAAVGGACAVKASAEQAATPSHTPRVEPQFGEVEDCECFDEEADAAMRLEECFYEAGKVLPRVATAKPKDASGTAHVGAGAVKEHVVRPWNNINENARAIHDVFPGTAVKVIKRMLRNRHNDAAGVVELLLMGDTAIPS